MDGEESLEAGLGVDRIPWLMLVFMVWSWFPPDYDTEYYVP